MTTMFQNAPDNYCMALAAITLSVLSMTAGLEDAFVKDFQLALMDTESSLRLSKMSDLLPVPLAFSGK